MALALQKPPEEPRDLDQAAMPEPPPGAPSARPRTWLSPLLDRASDPNANPTEQATRIKEVVAAALMTVRADLNAIEQDVGGVRDKLAVREQVLSEAIDQLASLSQESIRGTSVIRKVLREMESAYDKAMRPTPLMEVDESAESTSG